MLIPHRRWLRNRLLILGGGMTDYPENSPLTNLLRVAGRSVVASVPQLALIACSGKHISMAGKEHSVQYSGASSARYSRTNKISETPSPSQRSLRLRPILSRLQRDERRMNQKNLRTPNQRPTRNSTHTQMMMPQRYSTARRRRLHG